MTYDKTPYPDGVTGIRKWSTSDRPNKSQNPIILTSRKFLNTYPEKEKNTLSE